MKPPDDLPGADAIIDWFGYCPVFHDGYVLDIDFPSSTTATCSTSTFNPAKSAACASTASTGPTKRMKKNTSSQTVTPWRRSASRKSGTSP